MLVALTYVVLLGGTALGEIGTTLRVINAAISGVVIAWYLLRAPGDTDLVDRGILIALLLFLAACLGSLFPRQSLDAALSALTYAAAFYVARRRLADPRTRQGLVYVFIGLSCLLTLAAAVRWVVPMVEWWAAVGWRVAPPMNLELAAHPWGHRHDLTLIVAMLYPAWWLGRPAAIRRVAAVVFGILGALVVLLDGSRTVWLALALATGIVLAPPAVRRWRQGWLTARTAGAGVVIAVVLLTITGIGAALAQRAFSLTSLDWRVAMWGPLVDLWSSRPITGSGPGSFAWVLQQTSYFDTNSWAPRHPDNAAVQMLAEGGLLGIAALAVVVIALLPAVLRSSSRAAKWAVFTFGLATLGANPTDFAFLVVNAVAWTAYALPRATAAREPSSRVPLLRMAAVSGLGLIALAYGMTILGSFRYEDARAAIREGRGSDAVAALDDAVGLDPGMALYPRQRGAQHLLAGEPDRAVRDLELATRLNPSDDLAWRNLAMALDAVGDDEASRTAIDRAIRAQRSDPTNLLLRAAFDVAGGDDDAALDTLSEVVQAWPAIVFSPQWERVLPASVETADVVGRAMERWKADARMPVLPSDQGLWLVAMTGRSDLEEDAIERSVFDPTMARAHLLAVGCDPASEEVLDSLPPAAAQSPTYWHLRYRSSLLRVQPDEHVARIAALMHAPIRSDTVAEPLNPLDENGQLSADVWGYRRPPIHWPDATIMVPSPTAGATRWFFEPAEAVRGAGLEQELPACVGPGAR